MIEAKLRADVATQLEPLIGRHTASRAVDLAMGKAGIEAPLRPEDLEALCAALLPMLRALAGRASAQSVLDDIRALRR